MQTKDHHSMYDTMLDGIGRFTGWCPKHPVMHAAPVVLPTPPATLQARGSGPGAGPTGRIRGGIVIAQESMKALFRNRHLLWFSFFAGLVMLAMVAMEVWMLTSTGNAAAFLVSIPMGTSFLILNTRLFLLQFISFSCFIPILAGLVRYRSGKTGEKLPTIRDAFVGVSPHTISLTALAVMMSLIGMVLFAIITQTRFFGKIVSGITMAVFSLPYAYYFPNMFNSALYFSALLIIVTIIQFLLALYVVPFIVQENRGLTSALAGSAGHMIKTWRGIVGCLLVFGAFVLVLALVALVIGQSPQLLDNDYNFFLNVSRGKVLMMAISYGFVLACGVLVALGSTVFGIATADLYRAEKSEGTSGIPEGNLNKPETVS